MKKIILILISILISLFIFPIVEAGGQPAKISLDLFTVYEIGSSHTPGSNKTGGSQKCQVGAGDLPANCPLATPCVCNALVQENYYYRIEIEVANIGAGVDEFWGYYNSIGGLNGTVSSSSDIWVVEAGSPETCANSDWSNDNLTWVEGDSGCGLQLNNSSGTLAFIIQIGSGATDTSGGTVFAEEDAGATNEIAYVDITVVSALTCNFSTTTASFGTLTSSAVSTAYGSTTIDVTSAGTVFIKVQDSGGAGSPGLYKSSATTDLIGSANAASDNTDTLIVGTEGYGLQATSTDFGSGAAITIATRYDNASTTNDIGGFELTDVTMASSTAAVTNRRVILYYKAAASALNVMGSYSDSITYTCTTSE